MRFRTQDFNQHTQTLRELGEVEAEDWLDVFHRWRLGLGSRPHTTMIYLRNTQQTDQIEVHDPELRSVLYVTSLDEPLFLPSTGWLVWSDETKTMSHVQMEPEEKEKYERVPPTTEEAPPTAEGTSLDTLNRINAQELKLLQPTSRSYNPGETELFLTDIFMNLGDLHEQFGTNEENAIRYLAEFLWDRLSLRGIGVFLMESQKPLRLRCVEALGADVDLLLDVSFPIHQGILGFCARRGVGVNVSSFHREEFENENLRDVLPRVGPIMIAPVQYKHQLVGTILLYRGYNEEPFVPGEFSIFEYASHRLGEFLCRQKLAA
ncbi:MAG: hypothetical protein EP343_03265 [Deltaproteobacteria bacterium]|nr:MAG: hypothetical protein EP343_03265 [Deltaproteobacteria bacterium]